MNKHHIKEESQQWKLIYLCLSLSLHSHPKAQQRVGLYGSTAGSHKPDMLSQQYNFLKRIPDLHIWINLGPGKPTQEGKRRGEIKQEWQTEKGKSTWLKSPGLGNAGPWTCRLSQGSEMLHREEPQSLACDWDLVVPGSWVGAGTLIQALRQAGHWWAGSRVKGLAKFWEQQKIVSLELGARMSLGSEVAQAPETL